MTEIQERMLRMNSNILLSLDKTKFEAHFLGQKNLPFIFHKDRIASKSKECVPNLHLNLELLYFVEGCGNVICDGKTFAVQQGDVAVINSYAIHSVTTTDVVRYFCLIVDNDFCIANIADMSELQFASLIQNDTARALFELVIEEFDSRDTFRDAGIQCAVQQLLLFLCRNYSEPKPVGKKHDSARESVWIAVEFMKQNLSQKLTVEQIARSTGFSKYYFLRLFKAHTGYTVTRYLNLLRCDRAKQSLLSGCTVKEAAAQCGFENLSYFTKVFKNCIGLLPGTVQKQN